MKELEVNTTDVVHNMAREFLEYRLGILANQENVELFKQYIIKFENEITS